MEATCIRVPRKDGEAVRQELDAAGVLDHGVDIEATAEWVYLPITDDDGVAHEWDRVTRDLEPRAEQTLPADILGYAPSYERLGRIALIDADDEVGATEIAEALMASSLPIYSVLDRRSKIKGDHRVREWKLVAGDTTETIHREFGAEFLVDVTETYFSPRLATERQRVVEQVQDGERVIDMFAGVGPFAIQCALRGATVVAVDLNPDAVSYLEANIERNEVGDRVTAIQGDVRGVVDTYTGWADRLVMNLPHSAGEFLDTAMVLAAPSCRLHYYDIQHKSDPFSPGIEAIEAAAGSDVDVTIRNRRTVRSYAPHEVNVCLDVELTRKE